MDMGYALIADLYGLLFWALVVASICLGFKWLWDLVEHLDLRRSAVLTLVTGTCIALAVYIDAKQTELAAQAGNYEPGVALFGALWMLLGAACLVGPFVLLFSSPKCKCDSDKGTP